MMFKRLREGKAGSAWKEMGTNPGPWPAWRKLIPTVSTATSSFFARQLLGLCVRVRVLVSFSAFPPPWR